MTYVIRSMTTTDFVLGSKEGPRPYHIYLKKWNKRGGAYWHTWKNEDTAVFATIEEAQAEIDRALPEREDYSPRFDIVPIDDRNVPTFWDTRKGDYAAGVKKRVIGTEIVIEKAKKD